MCTAIWSPSKSALNGANQGVNLDCFAFDQYRLKSLDTEAVKRRRAIQQHRMFANDFFKDVPDNRLLPLDHFLRLFDCRCILLLLEQVVDERLEQLEGHLLRQAALMQFKLGTYYDYRSSRVVDALA
jgi:hypothetical protein